MQLVMEYCDQVGLQEVVLIGELAQQSVARSAGRAV
jgi:hypothetical protein